MSDVITLDIDYDSVFLPIYKPLRTTKSRLRFLYGGRDSGKSRDVAMRKIIQCLEADYFRCILIKKTANSIKDSQWQLIKDICDDWGISSLFKFTTHPLEITCINGNKFICRGMDDAAKIKSINNPSDAWCEEGNQLSLEDWIYIITTLRSDKGPVNIEMTFNTETKGDFEEFWLYKEYFAHTREKSFKGKKEIKIGEQTILLDYIAIHSTYHDNKYCDLERIAWHESLSTLNYYWYRVFTLGDWGNEENDSPWLFAYSKEKHVSKVELFCNRKYTLFASFDFNRNPHVCTLLQNYDETLFIIEVIKIPNVGTEGICEELLIKYPGVVWNVTGDYSGVTVSSIFKEQVTNYSMIRKMLNISKSQLRIEPNPKLEKNQTLVNTVFQYYRIQICPVKAKPFIYDAENVKKRADGSIVKDNREDPTQQADVLDTVRYWINKMMPDFIKKLMGLKARVKIAGQARPDYEVSNKRIIEITAKNITEQAALACIETGLQATVAPDAYIKNVRDAILRQAALWLQAGDHERAIIAYKEIKRLDVLYKIKPK